MPAFVIKILVWLALKFGLPWLIKFWPGIPESIIAIITAALEELAKLKAQRLKVIQNAKALSQAQLPK